MTMKTKIVTADLAVNLIRDGDALVSNGFVQSCIPEALLEALERRYLTTGSPKNLILYAAAGQADGKEAGLNRLGHEGLLKRVVAGNWGRMPKVIQLARENKIRGYNLPQGTITQLYRDQAAGKPGSFSKVGLHTFVDPRLEGGRINEVTTKDIVQVVKVDGEEWLFYKVAPVKVAFIRGTTADPLGNITMEKEALTLDNLSMAMAAKNSNGVVIAQVERIAEYGSLQRKDVRIPGILVDCVVVAKPEQHLMNYATQYDPALSGEVRVPVRAMKPLPLDERKIIARRAAFELPPNGIINLGVGVPEGVAAVANEEKVIDYVTMTTEAGTIGGVLASGPSFGAGINSDAVLNQNQMFDFYDGGGLDMACLGLAEVDDRGNVNVSRFGDRLIGCGGFINISQNARSVVFTGTFTAGGLKIAAEDGTLKILQEGRAKKFVARVQQISFSGDYAAERKQPVLYITERCVFRRDRRGMVLVEVAPGIDVERDILAHMDFEPVIGDVETMDARIFRPELIGLERELLNLDLPDRVTYDPIRGILFLNWEGMYLRTKSDVDAIWLECEKRCQEIGRRVGVIINYDKFNIDDQVLDDYVAMDRYFLQKYFSNIARYATNGFMRMKMGEAFAERNIAPHVFERKEEAQSFLDARRML